MEEDKRLPEQKELKVIEQGSASETDEALVVATINGKKESFNEFVRRYSRRIFGFVRRRISDTHAVEDIVQETFLRAFRSIQNCTRPEGFSLWLFQIARNCMKQWFDKNRLDSTTSTLDEVQAEATVNELRKEETRRATLMRVIYSLPEETRSVVLLKHEEDMSCAQIAQKVGKPVGTVTSILSRAYKAIRSKIQGENL